MNKTAFFLIPLLGSTLLGQVPEAPPPPPPPQGATVVPYLFTAEQLDQLLGPIALYPDALIALILPASTNPSDIDLAAIYLRDGGDPNNVEAQPWDDSVKALAHYPQVIRWMDENMVWTNQLGEAFTSQPAEVMTAIQRLRARARAVGTLVSTPQQQIVYEPDGTINIVPTESELIYVPYYDPTVIYAPHPGYSPEAFYGFSAGFATGWWLCYGFDWHHHSMWTVDRNDRERFWREHGRDWQRHPESEHRGAPPATVHPWRPVRRSEPPRSQPIRPRPPQWSDRPHDRDGGSRVEGPRSGGNPAWEHRDNPSNRHPSFPPPPAATGLRAPLAQPPSNVNIAPRPPSNVPPEVSRAHPNRDRDGVSRTGETPRPWSPPPRGLGAPPPPIHISPSQENGTVPGDRPRQAPGWQRPEPSANPVGTVSQPHNPPSAPPSRPAPAPSWPNRFTPPPKSSSPPPATPKDDDSRHGPAGPR